MAKRFKVILTALVAMFFVKTAQANCEEIKTKVESQLQAKGIQSYTIEIVPVVIPPANSIPNTTEVNQKMMQVGWLVSAIRVISS